MQKQKIIIFTILLILAGSLACTSNLTAETTGQVTNVVLDRDRKTTKRKTSSGKTKKTTKTEIDYSYAVDGKTYTGFSEKDGDVQAAFRSGSTVKVCYNPKNPEESDVFPLNAKCE